MSFPGAARRAAHIIALRAEKVVDSLRRPSRRRGAVHIHPYIGHGNSEFVVLRGRVLADPRLDVGAPDGNAAQRAWATVRRFASREIPGVQVTVILDGESTTVVTDEEGYYEARLPTRPGGVRRRGVATAAGGSVEVEVVVPGASAGGLLLISDIDDTVLETGAQRVWDVARATIFGSYRSRTPVPAMAELYRGLVRGPGGKDENATFYVSSSPWNLHDVLVAFLGFRGLPRGPLFLRDLGIDEDKLISTGHGTHKSAAINEILTMHAGHRAVLVGDTGQRDPEIYAEVARRHPGRIAAIYLRDVAGPDRDEQVDALSREAADHDVPLVRGVTAAAFAEHALAHGLISQNDLAAVRAALDSGSARVGP